MKKKNPYQAHFFNIKHLFFDICKWMGLPMLIWFRVKKIYARKEAKRRLRGGALIISNHILYSDPMVLHCAYWYRRLQFIVSDTILTTKFSRFFYPRCGCIPVNREHFSLSSFREIVQRLEGGNVITIFPEGHVSFSNENPMSPFKSGAVLMAYQSNVPIIPIYREIRKNIFRRQKIVVGEPIDIKATYGEKLDMRQIDAIARDLFDKEQELKRIYHEKVK